MLLPEKFIISLIICCCLLLLSIFSLIEMNGLRTKKPRSFILMIHRSTAPQ